MQAMRVDLVNVGPAARILYDTKTMPVYVGVGKVAAGDLDHDTVVKIHGNERETLLVTREGEGEVPEALREVVGLLAVVEFEEYSRMLSTFLRVAPPATQTETRPSRVQMREKLRSMVDEYVRTAAREPLALPAERLDDENSHENNDDLGDADAAIEAARVEIKEEADPAALQKDLEKQQSQQSPPAATPGQAPTKQKRR